MKVDKGAMTNEKQIKQLVRQMKRKGNRSQKAKVIHNKELGSNRLDSHLIYGIDDSFKATGVP